MLAPLAVLVAPATAAHAATESGCKSAKTSSACMGVPVSYQDGICWDSSAYVVANDYSDTWTDPVTGWAYTTVLFYSPDCKTNWADTVVAYADPNINGSFGSKVRRGPGSDGPYVMLHGPTVTAAAGTYTARAVSPMVWSPDNPAEACGTTPGDDNIGCSDHYY